MRVRQTWKPARGRGGGRSTKTKIKVIFLKKVTKKKKEFEHRYPEFVINVPETSIIKSNSQCRFRISPYGQRDPRPLPNDTSS